MYYHDKSIYGREAALQNLNMLRPQKLLGSAKTRVGKLCDGGYIMIDRFEDIEAAYSLGINDDVSWDFDMARRGIPCFQYDHTIEALPSTHPLFNWTKVGISDFERKPGFETISHLVDVNGHKDSRRLLLKCDIEGAEWGAFRQTPISVLAQFEQIVLELHDLQFISDRSHSENARSTLSNLTANHNVVHVHANNYGFWTVCGGIPVPNTLELTLMRKDAGEFVVSDEIFPTALDMPCNTEYADFYLGMFQFK